MVKSTSRTKAFRFAIRTTGRSSTIGSATVWRISSASCNLAFLPWRKRRCKTRSSAKRSNSVNSKSIIGGPAPRRLLALNSRSAKTTRPRRETSAASRPSTMRCTEASGVIRSTGPPPHRLVGALGGTASQISNIYSKEMSETPIPELESFISQRLEHQSPIPLGRHSR